MGSEHRRAARPGVLVFDVNETLSDTSALAGVFESVGLPGPMAPLWFAQVLRDGFALTAAGDNVGFREIAAALLPTELTEDRAEQVLSSFASLPLHPDVVPGLTRLADAGHRLVCFSNGSAEVARTLLRDSGVADRVEHFLSVSDAPAWKPGPQSYAYAAERCGVELGDLMLVAVHPWDINGAAAVGARTAWVNRSASAYPTHFRPPDVTTSALTTLLVE